MEADVGVQDANQGAVAHADGGQSTRAPVADQPVAHADWGSPQEDVSQIPRVEEEHSLELPQIDPMQELVNQFQKAAATIEGHVEELGAKVAAMQTESESKKTLEQKFDDIHTCLEALNQKVNKVVDMHGNIQEMQEKYAEVKSALADVEERE